MSKRAMLVVLALSAAAFGSISASAHGDCGSTAHKHTAAGSCKEDSGTDKGQLHCAPAGAPGEFPVAAGSVRLFINPADGEIEACNDEGPGITRGRLVVRVDQDSGFVRVSLDSTREQEPNLSAGFINAQAGPGADQTGIYCTDDTGRGDGYARPDDDPGTPGGEGGSSPDTWVECAPTLPFP